MLLTRQLSLGGAERQMVHLANGLAGHGHAVSVLSCYRGGALESRLDTPRVGLIGLDKRGRGDVVGFAARLRHAVRAARPEVIHSFLTVPNLLAVFAGVVAARNAAVVWGIRGTPLDLSQYDRLARFSIAAERLLAPRADLIIANATAGAEAARAAGFPAGRIAVIPNGIDTDALRPPNLAERAAARQALGAAPSDFLIAVVARFDPMKGHATFLDGFALAAAARPGLRAVLVGEGPAAFVDTLRARANRLGIAGRLTWLRARPDVTDIYHAADLLCLPSDFGEGFPNVLGEAMAAGLPCIATEVGDSAAVLGPCGRLIPPRDPARLAAALLDAIGDPSQEAARHRAARERVVARFGLGRMVDATEALLMQAVADHGRKPA